MRRAFLRAMTFALALGVGTAATRDARAQDLVPPKVLRDEGAQYPAQALKDGVRGAATVVLVLEIDATGAVKGARVETSAGHGFDEAALAAANKLVFSPATRDGAPIPARIRHTYTFNPPASRLKGQIVSMLTNGPIAGASVVVRGPDGVDRATTTSADGSWRIDGVPAGSYHVSVASPGMTSQSADENVGPGEEANLTFRLSEPPLPPSTAPAPATARASEDEEEVTVQGERPPREVSKRTLTRDEIAKIPGTNGDALRSLQNLPGVARPPGLAGLLIVRGSAPQDTNIFVDGTPVPIVYHFGGLSSVVPTELLDKIDFYPGNYSAQYGRGMGGIVDVGLRDPKHDKLHGMAQVDLIDARVMAEGPIGNTGWDFAVAGRRSWLDLWLGPVLEKAGAGVTTAPVYYDYQAMVGRDLGHGSSFRLAFFGSDDRLDILVKNPSESDPGLAGGISNHTGFWRLQGRYKGHFSDATEFKLTAAVGQDKTEFGVGDDYLQVNTVPISARAELSQKLTSGVIANVGLDLIYSSYDVHVRFPPIPQPGQPAAGAGLSQPARETTVSGTRSMPGMYAELELVPMKGTRIVPGVRADYSDDTKGWDVAPRINVRQDLTSGFPRTTLKGGAGLFYQPPQPQETNAVFGQAGLRSNRSVHYDLGVEQELTKNIDVSVDAFEKELDRLVVQNYFNAGQGRVYGIEWLVRYKPDDKFFGWIAYTLSRSERQDTPDSPMRLFQYDQTHIFTALGSYKLGRGWQLGARFRIVSGSLYTPNAYGAYDENAGAYLPVQSYPPFGSRLPLFHQLDVRVDKTWTFQDWRLSAYLDLQNVYNHQSAEGTTYNFNYTQQGYVGGLPILPSLGVRGEF